MKSPYIALGETALVGSGLGELGQEELDRISTGRQMGFDFGIDETAFTLSAQTRAADLARSALSVRGEAGRCRAGIPTRVIRAKAAAQLTYESYATSPGGVLGRDLDYILRGDDARYATPDLDMLADVTPERFPQGLGTVAESKARSKC